MATVEFSVSLRKREPEICETWDLQEIVPNWEELNEEQIDDQLRLSFESWVQDQLSSSWEVRY